MNRLGLVAVLALAVSLLTGCAGQSAAPAATPAAATPDRPNRLVYIPTWEDAEEYNRISQLPLADVDLAIAFAVPTADGGVTAPTIPDGLTAVAAKLDQDAGITLAVGGWGGTDEEHQSILDGFAAAASQPAAFATAVADAVNSTGTALGRPVTGVDIDWEYPTAEQGPGFAGLVTALKKALPSARITAAVPSDHDQDGIEAALPKVGDALAGVHVMTYDEHTPFDGADSTSGPVASRQNMLAALQQWQDRLRSAGLDPSVASLGLPTYCYAYTGVSAAGQPSQGGQEIAFPQVDAQALQSQPDGSSAGVIGGAWTSCLTPDDAAKVVAAAPTGTGLFYWSAEGLTAEYLQVGR